MDTNEHECPNSEPCFHWCVFVVEIVFQCFPRGIRRIECPGTPLKGVLPKHPDRDRSPVAAGGAHGQCGSLRAPPSGRRAASRDGSRSVNSPFIWATGINVFPKGTGTRGGFKIHSRRGDEADKTGNSQWFHPLTRRRLCSEPNFETSSRRRLRPSASACATDKAPGSSRTFRETPS